VRGCRTNFDQLIRFRNPSAACNHLISLTVKPTRASGRVMHDIASLVETYFAAERDLVAAVELAGGAALLPDGRTVTVGRAEFDAMLGKRRTRAWVLVRKQAPMPARR
jgi:hypothetical protein